MAARNAQRKTGSMSAAANSLVYTPEVEARARELRVATALKMGFVAVLALAFSVGWHNANLFLPAITGALKWAISGVVAAEVLASQHYVLPFVWAALGTLLLVEMLRKISLLAALAQEKELTREQAEYALDLTDASRLEGVAQLLAGLSVVVGFFVVVAKQMMGIQLSFAQTLANAAGPVLLLVLFYVTGIGKTLFAPRLPAQLSENLQRNRARACQFFALIDPAGRYSLAELIPSLAYECLEKAPAGVADELRRRKFKYFEVH